MRYAQSLKLILTVVIAAAIAPTAWAKCDAGSQTLFSCTTTNGKQIEVCDAKKTIDYSYGRTGSKPELSLRVPRADASTYQWQGVGRYMSYSVKLPNGKTEYSVYWGFDRLTEEHAEEAGVNVTVNGKQVATVKCGAGKIIQKLEGVNLKPAD